MTPSNDASVPRERSLVLIVEDHQDTRQMYAEFLGITFDVITASDGHQGLDRVRARRPDLVITDLFLPGLDGFELITAIRKERSPRDIPIVCLSGYGGHAYEQRAHDAGADRILQKPCMPDTLADVAAELLQASRERRMQA